MKSTSHVNKRLWNAIQQHWVEYNQRCEQLRENALICVGKEGTVSADLTEGTSQLSIPRVRPLLERNSTLDVKLSIYQN